MTNALHITLTDPAQARQALSCQLAPYARRLWAEGVTRISVQAEPEEDARTIQQLRFLWGVVYKELSEQARIDGQKYAPDAYHELGKRMFLPRVHKKVRVAGKKQPVVYTTIGSTKGLSTKRMARYIEELMAWGATEYGVEFSLRRWEEYRP